MKTIKNVEQFPFKIRQRRPDWCIPANIEAVTKYHEPTSQVNQQYLATQLHNSIGLEHVKRVLGDDSNFGWANIEYCNNFQRFDDLIHDIEKGVCDSVPRIISIPARSFDGTWNGGWHMLTVIGYDECLFRVYDSNRGLVNDYYDIHKEGI